MNKLFAFLILFTVFDIQTHQDCKCYCTCNAEGQRSTDWCMPRFQPIATSMSSCITTPHFYKRFNMKCYCKEDIDHLVKEAQRIAQSFINLYKKLEIALPSNLQGDISINETYRDLKNALQNIEEAVKPVMEQTGIKVKSSSRHKAPQLKDCDKSSVCSEEDHLAYQSLLQKLECRLNFLSQLTGVS